MRQESLAAGKLNAEHLPFHLPRIARHPQQIARLGASAIQFFLPLNSREESGRGQTRLLLLQ
jgi:hypothetical protein